MCFEILQLSIAQADQPPFFLHFIAQAKKYRAHLGAGGTDILVFILAVLYPGV